MKSNNASPDRIKRSIHADEVLRLRLSGLSYREIGRKMGFSEQRAWKICTQELERLNKKRTEDADKLRRLETARLDALLQGHWDKAIQGDCRATDRVLSIMSRRAKLMGLDIEESVLSIHLGKKMQDEMDQAKRQEFLMACLDSLAAREAEPSSNGHAKRFTDAPQSESE